MLHQWHSQLSPREPDRVARAEPEHHVVPTVRDQGNRQARQAGLLIIDKCAYQIGSYLHLRNRHVLHADTLPAESAKRGNRVQPRSTASQGLAEPNHVVEQNPFAVSVAECG